MLGGPRAPSSFKQFRRPVRKLMPWNNRLVDDIDPAAESESWSRTFGSNAEGYNKYRQPLSPQVVRWLGVVPGSTALDVGAGTGQASRTLSALEATVSLSNPTLQCGKC